MNIEPVSPQKVVSRVTGNPPVNYTAKVVSEIMLYGGVIFQLIALDPQTIIRAIPHPPAWLSGVLAIIGAVWKIGQNAQAANTQAKG